MKETVLFITKNTKKTTRRTQRDIMAGREGYFVKYCTDFFVSFVKKLCVLRGKKIHLTSENTKKTARKTQRNIINSLRQLPLIQD